MDFSINRALNTSGPKNCRSAKNYSRIFFKFWNNVENAHKNMIAHLVTKKAPEKCFGKFKSQKRPILFKQLK